MTAVAAVDLGASSGRVLTGVLRERRLEAHEVHRFANVPVHLPDGLYWNFTGLFAEIVRGVAAAAAATPLAGVGIDTWGVDFGLLDERGRLLGLPRHYRDPYTQGMVARAAEHIDPWELYRATGIQTLPINTVYQLLALQGTPHLEAARRLLLVPDLLNYWLTGEYGCERTIASTSGLLDARTGQWAWPAIERLGLPARIFTEVHAPGRACGRVRHALATECGLPEDLAVVSVAAHDTASAVLAIPAQAQHWAFISCGTWSLVGAECDAPILTREAFEANFTNESGYAGTTRFLKNVMGMWIFEECRRAWRLAGVQADAEALLAAAAELPTEAIVDTSDASFFARDDDMPARIAAYCERTAQRPPRDPAAVTRCIVASLARDHARAIETLKALTGRPVEVVHLVGGGARNALLCQLTADACGCPVLAGPAEATALGNLLAQFHALGQLADLAEIRRVAAASFECLTYTPRAERSL